MTIFLVQNLRKLCGFSLKMCLLEMNRKRQKGEATLKESPTTASNAYGVNIRSYVSINCTKNS